MAKILRVHELAKELGMSNQETLDLCGKLGIGVKTQSSTIIEQQADRVRAKAEREGLVREQQPEEPKPVKKAAKKAAPKKADDGEEKPVKKAAKKAVAKKAPAKKAAAKKTSTDETVDAPKEVAETSNVEPAAPVAPIVSAPVISSARPITSAAPVAKPAAMRPAAPIAPTAPVAPATAPAAPVAPVAPVESTASAAPAAAPMPPRTAPSGRQIPPPPGSSRPIPPPPGSSRPSGPVTGRPPMGPRPGGPGAGRPSGGAGARTGRLPASALGRGPVGTGGPMRPSAPGAGRPSGGPGAGRPGGPSRSFGGPGAGRPGGGPGGPGAGRPGGGPGGPGGGRPGAGGRGNGQRRSPKKKSRARRRQDFDEMLPQSTMGYTASNAPVPEGIVVIERGSSAQEFAPKLNRTSADVVRFLMEHGEMVTATMTLADEQMELFAIEVGAEMLLVDPGQQEEMELQALFDDSDDDDPEQQMLRSPVITVMGHVDHGKTTLLDRIRSTSVVTGEAGGITQHIGAYQVEKNGKSITFIDTPGHAAFTKMRARGAQVTDIVVLMVAADDGVMPQTIEAISHARAAEVPIVVAINKIDKDNADVPRVMAQLAEQGLTPESWGGDTIVVEMAAQSGLGVDDLLEQLSVVSEIEELTANPTGRAKGIVLEAQLDIGRGPVATVLVDKGTLKVGDPMVAGAAWGKVRAIINDKGQQIKEAGPSSPVQILGLSTVPNAGDEFRAAPNEKTARTVAESREQRFRTINQRGDARVQRGVKLEDIFSQIQAGEVATLNVIIKSDVHGSLEAVTESLRKLESEEVRAAFVHRAVGAITENDIALAAATNATLIGFNVRPDRKVRDLAEAEGVEIRTYEIIYKLIEDIEKAMKGMLAPEFEEVVTGEAEVREVFKTPKVGAIAGCSVRTGVITRGTKVRFLRDGTIIWKGAITSLRRFKDDVREVREGFECGIGLSDFQDLKPGDLIETFELREIARD
ncbi:MAG: translation initiation factor IF-2 [Actinobacteria bacterium]|nr:translation initiation factor IF-2 [Actinomycetota bacterium]